MNVDIHPLMVTAIQGFHNTHNEVAAFVIDRYTEYHSSIDNSFVKENCIFCATNWYRGEPWYDFTMGQFTDLQEPDLADYMCPPKFSFFSI